MTLTPQKIDPYARAGITNRERYRERTGIPMGPVDHLLKTFDLALPIFATAEHLAKPLRIKYGDRQVVSLLQDDVHSIIASPGLGVAQAFTLEAIKTTEPMRGAVAMLLPHAFDAVPHGGIFRHPAFHAKLVLPESACNGPILAWYLWLHRLSLQGRKGGPRIVYA